jgi:hypothetical protein
MRGLCEAKMNTFGALTLLVHHPQTIRPIHLVCLRILTYVNSREPLQAVFCYLFQTPPFQNFYSI